MCLCRYTHHDLANEVGDVALEFALDVARVQGNGDDPLVRITLRDLARHDDVALQPGCEGRSLSGRDTPRDVRAHARVYSDSRALL